MSNLDVYGNDVLHDAYETIQNNVSIQQASLAELESKNHDLMKKQHIQLNQMKEIEDKEKLLITRSRMLQISQDRNAYKKKNYIFTYCCNIYYFNIYISNVRFLC